MNKLMSFKTFDWVQSFWHELTFLPPFTSPGCRAEWCCPRHAVHRCSPLPGRERAIPAVIPPAQTREHMDSMFIAGTSQRREIAGALKVSLQTEEMVQYDALNSSSLERQRERVRKARWLLH